MLWAAFVTAYVLVVVDWPELLADYVHGMDFGTPLEAPPVWQPITYAQMHASKVEWIEGDAIVLNDCVMYGR